MSLTAPMLPAALIVMDENRRDAVYPAHVVSDLSGMVRWAHAPMTSAQLAEHPQVLAEVKYLFTSWGAPRLEASLLAHAPQLQVVFMAAGSVRPVVTEESWRRGIQIVSAAAANAIPVAEFTVAQILLGLKNTHRITREMAQQSTVLAPSRSNIPGAYRRSVAVLSLGDIGLRVAKNLSGFDLHVNAYDPFLRHELAQEMGIGNVSLEHAFAESDVVSCHVPLLDATRGLIGEKLLRSMKPGAVFLNTARGEVVDEEALIEVLTDRTDLTALLDVTVEEPLPADSPLRSLPNVFLTAHSAGSQGHECWRLGELVRDECARHIDGLPLRHAVTETAARLRA